MNLYRWMRIAKRLLAVSLVASIAAITISDAFAEELRKKYPGEAHANAFVIEEVIVEGERPNPDSMVLNTMEVFYRHKETSARNFKIGNYQKAFPTLIRLAKLGFKDEQARVG